MRNFKGILPGMFTMGNLACGFGSIVISSGHGSLISPQSRSNLFEAVWLIILAGFLDFLDGLVARFSRSSSRFGVELDSLTDIISFGVAPAVLLVSYSLIPHGNWGLILAFVYLMSGLFRLARFNVSANLEKKLNFVGMPIPAAAILIISYILFSYEVWGEIRMEKFFIILILATSALMVSTVEFETMPRFDFTKPKNRVKVLFIFLMAAVIMYNASLTIFPMALLYVMYGVVKLLVSMFISGGRRGMPKTRVAPHKTKEIKEQA